jgi:hypothetical protein
MTVRLTTGIQRHRIVLPVISRQIWIVGGQSIAALIHLRTDDLPLLNRTGRYVDVHDDRAPVLRVR